MAVYIVEALGLNTVKIGYSGQEDVRPRMMLLQTGCPRRLEVLRVVGAWDREHEAALHARFAADRVIGEWFRFSDAIRYWLGGVPAYPPNEDREQVAAYVARMWSVDRDLLGPVRAAAASRRWNENNA